MSQSNKIDRVDCLMGRKRVANPRISFSISMSQTMKQEIDHRLTYNSDRSKWIVAAIHAKLNQEDKSADALSQAPMADLLIEMMSRTYHPAFKSMFTKGDVERIDLWKEKSRSLPDSD